MGDKPARRFFVDLRRRNEFDEWGLELQGGWSGGATWVEVAYVRQGSICVINSSRNSFYLSLKLCQE